MHIQADSAPNCLLRPRHLFPPRFTRHLGLSTPITLALRAVTSGDGLAATCAQARRRVWWMETMATGPGRNANIHTPWRRWTPGASASTSPPVTLGEGAAALDWVLDLPPEHCLCAVMLSFGDARPIPRALQPSVLH